MKLTLPRLLALAGLFLGALGLHAQTTVNYTSPFTEVGRDSTGADLDTGYVFALGTFAAFTPTSLNTTDWATNFTSLGSVNWDDVFTNYSGSADLLNNNAPFTVGAQGYVWGYNTQTITTGTEWILITNTNWTFPLSGSTPTVNWDASDVGTITVVGSVASSLGSIPYLQTASMMMAAVPEPSTYAVIFGLIAIAGVAYKRRQLA
jgi:hypothetical protein